MAMYDKILELYSTNLEEGRILLYQQIPKLAIHSPYFKITWAYFTKDDIHSEMFMFLDWILTSDRERKSKFYYIWNVFHRMPNSLNKVLKFPKEYYWYEVINESTYEIDDVEWILEYVMDIHEVLTPTEKKIFSLLKGWLWPTVIGKRLWIPFYKARDLCSIVVNKTKQFLNLMDKDVTDIR